MSVYNKLITGFNFDKSIRFESTATRLVKTNTNSFHECDLCFLQYPYSCLEKKENGSEIVCKEGFYYKSKAQDLLEKVKTDRF